MHVQGTGDPVSSGDRAAAVRPGEADRSGAPTPVVPGTFHQGWTGLGESMGRSDGLSRRKFLSSSAAAAGGAALIGVGGPVALAGCASSTSSGSSATSGGAASAASAGVGTGTPRRGGSAILATTSEIDGFYPPSNHWDATGFLYANTVFDPLVAVGADGSAQPYLAESVTPNPDNTVWTVRLRPGVTFSDGSALTSSVLKANFDALKASPLTGIALQIVEKAAIVDPLSVAFTCTGPNVAFPYYLTSQVGYVFGTAMIDAASGSGPATPVGTGPFVYSSWQPNDHFTATRNPHYWRPGYPYLDAITFRPIADTTQRESTLKTGAVDLIYSADPNTVDHFNGVSGYQVVTNLHDTVGEPDMDFVMLNCAKPPTDDLRVRQALAHGLDATALAKLFGGGLEQPATGLFPPGSPYYSPTTYPTFDQAAARSLVHQYAAQHGTPSVQLGTVTDPRLSRVVQAIQQMWQQVGFDVSLQIIDQASFITNAITGDFQAYTFEQFSAADPDLNYVWWSTTTIAAPGKIGLNFARNADPQIEQAMVAARGETNRAARIADYQKVNERFAVDLPYLWLGRTVWSEVSNQRLQNFAGMVLPDGTRAKPFDNGVSFTAQMWMAG